MRQANELNNLLDQQEQAIWDGGAGGAGAAPPGVAPDAGYGSDVWSGQEQSPYGKLHLFSYFLASCSYITASLKKLGACPWEVLNALYPSFYLRELWEE